MNNDGTDVQLYNIIKDKNETTNEVANQLKIASELKGKLLAWWRSMPRLNQ